MKAPRHPPQIQRIWGGWPKEGWGGHLHLLACFIIRGHLKLNTDNYVIDQRKFPF
jgi:hypothetical protein